MNLRGYGTCDLCGKRHEGVLVHDHNEVPVLFQCRACEPDAYLDALGRTDEVEPSTIPGIKIQRTLPPPTPIVL